MQQKTFLAICPVVQGITVTCVTKSIHVCRVLRSCTVLTELNSQTYPSAGHPRAIRIPRGQGNCRRAGITIHFVFYPLTSSLLFLHNSCFLYFLSHVYVMMVSSSLPLCCISSSSHLSLFTLINMCISFISFSLASTSWLALSSQVCY